MAILPVAWDTAVGRTPGHYRPVEKIRAGGMASALDEHLFRDVVTKVLPPGTLTDKSAHKHFQVKLEG